MFCRVAIFGVVLASATAEVSAFATATASTAGPVLSSAVISGSTVYGFSRLFAVYREQIGRPLTQASARAVVAELENMYERDGYSRPQLRIDERPMAAGILRIEVLEPRFTQVVLKGNWGPYRQKLEAFGAEIRESHPVRPSEVQRVLRAIRELPGLSVTTVTRPDDALSNGFVLTLNTSYKPVEGLVRASDRGSREIGPAFVDGQVVSNGILGRGEKLGVLFTAATQYSEYHGAGVFVDTPVGGRGTDVFLVGFRSLSDPHEYPVDLPDIYSREQAMLRVTRPVWTGVATSLALSGAFEVDNLVIDRDGSALSIDRLRILDFGAQFTWRSGMATQYAAAFDVRQGLRGFGSESLATDLADETQRRDFLLTRLQLVTLSRIDERWSVRMDALAQQTGYVLPYSEQFKIGGDVLGRSFEVPEVAGDRGAGAKVQFLRDIQRELRVLGKASLYGFYDLEAAWSQSGHPIGSAATAGAGLVANRGPVAGYLEVAKPLTHPDVDGRKNARLFFEISSRF